MRFKNSICGLAALLLLGCGNWSKPPISTVPQIQTYYGSSTVGDFLQITVDIDNNSMNFSDLSTGVTTTATYVLAADGGYELDDATGNLVGGFESDDDELMVLMTNKAGASQTTPALSIAVPSAQISISSVANTKLNFFQLGTSRGGFEIGSGSFDATGDLALSTYWPLGASFEMIGTSPFHNGSFPVESVGQDPGGAFLTLTGVDGSTSYVFGNTHSYIVDRPNSTLLGFEQTASSAFDPIHAGSYKVNLLQKLGVTSTDGSDESVGSSFDVGTLVIFANGNITLSNSKNNVIAEGQLAPVANQTNLYNESPFFSLKDPCLGVFTFHVNSTAAAPGALGSSSQVTVQTTQDVFIGFRGDAVVLASFTKYSTPGSEGPYDYFYGFGHN